MNMRNSIRYALLFSGILVSNIALADITIPMYLVAPSGHGKSIGTIVASDSPSGLVLTPHLSGLTPGAHGFHVHQNPSCSNNGMAAGEHLDPHNTHQHTGPNGNGHLGDLPVLIVDSSGQADTPMTAPRLNTSLLKGHTLMIHANGDNYSDIPAANGGGGKRIACGVVP
jgi:superoxide dismutase, Cu-Zn family